MRSQIFKNSFVYILIIAAIVTLVMSVFGTRSQPEALDISQLAEQVRQGKVEKIEVNIDGNLTITYKDQSTAETARKEPNVSIFDTLLGLGVSKDELSAVEISIEPESPWTGWITLGITILPLLLIGGLLYFMVKQAQGSNSQAMSFGKSRAKMFAGDKPTVTFEDVAGADEAKEELAEVVEFLKEPEKFIALGARIPKGVLMVGPPGCGKTLMAKAVSGEAGVPFFSISGSDFVEMFVGVGASRVRDLFDQAKRNSPCIIFIDEIDAVGRHRGAGLGGSHDEREQTLNQILVEMDGFDTDTNVIMIAATNRPDILDPALLRPGRFDRRVIMDRPDWQGRRQILNVHMRGKPISANVDRDVLAKRTIGFVGADLENMVNEAAILAARHNKKEISQADLEDAVEKVQLGPERRSRVVPEKEKEVVAYHEAGHALVGFILEEADPIQKVTIVPRGMAGGVTWFLPEDDRTLVDSSYLEAQLAVALGGRVAEEVVFGDITTGASADLQSVTKTARAMVTEYGMSEKLGPMMYGEKEELVFLGRELGEQRNYSDETAAEIDREVRHLVDNAYDVTHKIITDYRNKLDEIARRLLDQETLDAAEFKSIFETETPDTSAIPA